MNHREWFESRQGRSPNRCGYSISRWVREANQWTSDKQRHDWVNSMLDEISAAMWTAGIKQDNPHLIDWMMECWGLSYISARAFRRKIKTTNPLVLLARCADE